MIFRTSIRRFEILAISTSDFPAFLAFFIMFSASETVSCDILVYEYFLNPISTAISLKHCLRKFRPYDFIWAPNRPHFSHFILAMPIFLSLGLQCLMNFCITAGFPSSCFSVFLQSLAVILYEFCVELFLHVFDYFIRAYFLPLRYLSLLCL